MPGNDQQHRIDQVRKVASLLSNACDTLVSEWEKEDAETDAIDSRSMGGAKIPSTVEYDAQRTIAAAMGKLQELTCDPQRRILELTLQFYDARALHIVSEHRVADVLAEKADNSGQHIQYLSTRTGIDQKKLMRIMRFLVSEGIFCEIAPDIFANNRISGALVNDEATRAYIKNSSDLYFPAALHLPEVLARPDYATSHQPDRTAFQLSRGTILPFFDWLSEKIPISAEQQGQNGHEGQQVKLAPRPELALFNQSMVHKYQAGQSPALYAYPWRDLGRATVVDVGGGIGQLCLQLSQLYPDLQLVVQDRPDVIEQAHGFWKKENPQALESGSVQLMAHDFFTPNPVTGADIYMECHVIHDWSDSYSTEILKGIAASMKPSSRLLLVEQVMNTTLGCDALHSAPDPLPANYGHFVLTAHHRDINMMTMINGTERTPAEFVALLASAGLELVKIREERCVTCMLECRLASS